MQSRERQGGSAQGCGSAAGGQVAELQPWDLEAATDKFVEQVRQSARQHAVVVGAFGVRERRRGATVRLMRRVHVRNEQEQVRMLTEENAALRVQLALQAERLRADALVEVCCLFITRRNMPSCSSPASCANQLAYLSLCMAARQE